MSNKDWWTPERKEQQRDRIMQVKPWEKSTGPTSPEGKAICSRNACKPDSTHKRIKALSAQLKATLKEQKDLLKSV